MEKVLKKLLFRPFSTKEAVKSGLSKTDLTRLVKEGVLDRLSHGVYEVSEETLSRKGSDDDSGWRLDSGSGAGQKNGSGGDQYTDSEKDYITATLKCGTPSAICLLSALEYYHVTDQIADKTWMLVLATKRVTSSRLRLLRTRNPQWNKGIQKNKDYWMTTLERTLIDCLLYRRLIGTQVALEALKYAVSQKKVKLKDILDLAKKMKVLHRILPYLEVLAS